MDKYDIAFSYASEQRKIIKKYENVREEVKNERKSEEQ